MTAAQLVGLTLLAAPIALMAAVLVPLLWRLHRIDRHIDAEWGQIVAAVEGFRAEVDDFADWEAEVSA